MSDQPLSEEELAKLLAESNASDQDAPELFSDTPPSDQQKQKDEKPAEDSDSEDSSADRALSQAEIDALLASLGGD